MQRAGLPSRPALPAYSHTHLSNIAVTFEYQGRPCQHREPTLFLWAELLAIREPLLAHWHG